MADLIDATGLVLCNRGNSSTFNKGSIIDITIASPRTAQRTSEWKILDEESVSGHFYLTYEIGTETINGVTPRMPKVDLLKLKASLDAEKHHPFLY